MKIAKEKKLINRIYQVSSNNFLQAKRNISFCDQTNLKKLTIYGPKALDLLNLYSIRDIRKIEEKAFCTIMMKHNQSKTHKKFICEVQIVRVSPLRYVLISEDFNNLYKILMRKRKKFSLVTIENSTNQFAYFSFHGEKAKSFFSETNPQGLCAQNIYKTQRQNYSYYILLTSNINKFACMDYFKEVGFEEITSDIYNIFLLNNNVLLNLNKIKRKSLNDLLLSLYYQDNYALDSYNQKNSNKRNKHTNCVIQFEATKNFIVSSNIKILNQKRKKIGFVHNYYRLSNKKHPFLLGIIKKIKTEKIALLKVDDDEIIIKEYNAN